MTYKRRIDFLGICFLNSASFTHKNSHAGDGSAVRMLFRRPGFPLKHPHGGSQMSTSVLGDLAPSSGLLGYPYIHGAQIYI